MDKAVGYIKSQTDKKKAFDAITKKYGDQLSEKQVGWTQEVRAMSMREQLTERVGKLHLSYSSLKYALGDMRLWEMYMLGGQLKKESEALYFGSSMTCSCSNQKNSTMSTTLSMTLAFVSLLAASILATPNVTRNGKPKQRKHGERRTNN